MKQVRLLVSGLWAAVALLVGHDLAYRIVIPETSARGEYLTHTGHGWLAVVAPAFLIALTAALIGSFLEGRRSHISTTHSFAVRGVTQAAVYILLELGERLFTGHSLEAIAEELINGIGLRLLLVGIAAQLMAAGLAALLARGAQALGRYSRRVTPRTPASLPVSLYYTPRLYSSNALKVSPSRGPPSSSRTLHRVR